MAYHVAPDEELSSAQLKDMRNSLKQYLAQLTSEIKGSIALLDTLIEAQQHTEAIEDLSGRRT